MLTLTAHVLKYKPVFKTVLSPLSHCPYHLQGQRGRLNEACVSEAANLGSYLRFALTLSLGASLCPRRPILGTVTFPQSSREDKMRIMYAEALGRCLFPAASLSCGLKKMGSYSWGVQQGPCLSCQGCQWSQEKAPVMGIPSHVCAERQGQNPGPRAC